MSDARLLAPVRFAYAEFVEGPGPLDRVPFPAAGFPEPGPGIPDLSRPWVYEADLWYAPAGASGTPARVPLRDGLPAAPYFLPMLEGAPYRVTLDAWWAPVEPLAVGGAAWAHPGPPALAGADRVVPGKGHRVSEVDGVDYQVWPVTCGRFAWWRRLEILLEALARMYGAFKKLRIAATEALAWADSLNRLLAAEVTSSPTRLFDPEVRRAQDGLRRQQVTLLLAAEGLGTAARPLPPELVRFLQQYANVCALVLDVLLQPAFHVAILAHHASLPDQARAMVPMALVLFDFVPPGRGAGRDGPATQSPRYGRELLKHVLDPWSAGAGGAPAPAAGAPGPWALLVACGRWAVLLAVPAARRADGLPSFVAALCEALRALAGVFTWSGDREAAGGMADLRSTVVEALEAARAAVHRRLASGTAGAAGAVEAAAEFLRAPFGARMDEITRRLIWPLKFPNTLAVHNELDIGVGDVTGPLHGPAGRWHAIPIVDLVWQVVYLTASLAAADYSKGFDLAHLVAVDGFAFLGNVANSVKGLVVLRSSSVIVHEVAGHLGKGGVGYGLASTVSDLVLFFVEYVAATGDRLESYRTGDAESIRLALALSATGKALSIAGAVPSAAAPVLTALGTFLDYAGQIAARTLEGGAQVGAAYDALEHKLVRSLKRLAKSGPALGSRALVDPRAIVALHRLRAYDGFRSLDPDIALRYGLLEGK